MEESEKKLKNSYKYDLESNYSLYSIGVLVDYDSLNKHIIQSVFCYIKCSLVTIFINTADSSCFRVAII